MGPTSTFLGLVWPGRSNGAAEWGKRTSPAYDPSMRPATAIVLLILLAIIAIAGVIQLWLIF